VQNLHAGQEKPASVPAGGANQRKDNGKRPSPVILSVGEELSIDSQDNGPPQDNSPSQNDNTSSDNHPSSDDRPFIRQ
jgi:hypothetical protein